MLAALGRLDGVWLPARLSSPIHYQVWWCHSGTTCTDPYSHIHTHAHTVTQWHTPSHKERESFCHTLMHTHPTEILPKADLHSYSLGVDCKIFTYAWKFQHAHHRHVHASTTMCTHIYTVNEKQDSCECLARVWSFSQINVSRLQGSREAHISTQY